jgi:E3 ubiquitin-protein ligase RNFT1
MVRQAVMAIKCMLLMYYKNSRGSNYRRQVSIFSRFTLCYKIIVNLDVMFYSILHGLDSYNLKPFHE